MNLSVVSISFLESTIDSRVFSYLFFLFALVVLLVHAGRYCYIELMSLLYNIIEYKSAQLYGNTNSLNQSAKFISKMSLTSASDTLV